MPQHFVSVFAVMALAACGDASDTPVDAAPGGDAQPPDAQPPDAAVDAGPASPFLVGAWRKIPSARQEPPPPPEERAVVTVAADGMYRVDEESGIEVGTWQADDRMLTVVGTSTRNEPYTIGMLYYASPDRLMMPALFPVGTVDGPIGTWRDEQHENGTPKTTTLELRADLTATMTTTTRTLQGTWAQEADGVVFTTMINTTTLHIHIQEIRGVVMGSLYERLPSANAAPKPWRRPRALGRPGTHVEWPVRDRPLPASFDF